MEIMDKKTAKELGLKKYFSGIPCINGHISERYTSGVRDKGKCVECEAKRRESSESKEYRLNYYSDTGRKANRDLYMRNYREKNKSSIIALRKDRYSKNKEAALVYNREYNARNRGAVAEYKRLYTLRKKGELSKKRKIYYLENREAILKRNKGYSTGYGNRPERKPILLAQCRSKQLAKIQRTPTWANLEAIKEFYILAARLTLETGIKHHVDHIIPLQGKTVSGFHVESNLRVIPAKENLSKGNRLLEDLL